jgi:hypothetical protein
MQKSQIFPENDKNHRLFVGNWLENLNAQVVFEHYDPF